MDQATCSRQLLFSRHLAGSTQFSVQVMWNGNQSSTTNIWHRSNPHLSLPSSYLSSGETFFWCVMHLAATDIWKISCLRNCTDQCCSHCWKSFGWSGDWRAFLWIHCDSSLLLWVSPLLCRLMGRSAQITLLTSSPVS
jgi:hypothetical protein